MKNAILSGNALSRLAKPVVFTLFSLSLLGTAVAQPIGDNPKAVPVEVTYVGNVNGAPLIQIDVTNLQGQDVSLSLRDESGELIYADTIKDKAYTRKLQFDNLDLDKLKVVLTLRTKKDVQTQTFEITRNTRTVEDLAVVSL